MPLSEHVYCVAMAFKMTEGVKQWICIKFCIKLEYSCMETIQMIQKVFRDEAVSAAQIKVWHKHFKDGRESIESDPCSEGLQHAEHLRMWKVYRVQSTKISNWLRELEADLGIPNTTVSEILMQDLGMKRVVAKFILVLLLPEQKEHHAAVGRAVWGPKVPTLKGTEASLSCV